MKKVITACIFCVLLALRVTAQPPNDACSTAQSVLPTSCTAGTTTGADDSWIGSVGCQTGGSHPDAWYTFVATQNQLNINITSLGIGSNVEFVLAESPCGTCACSFTLAGSACGPAPLVDSIVGLNIGSTYYFTISSSGASGAFNACITNLAAVNVPGQDCPTASLICNEDPFSQATIASGSGAISGLGSAEDVNTLSCFGSSERQSQWYKFTCSQSGTIQFNINPIVSSNDYDFLLLDITTSGCNLLGGPATVVACNWSGCRGSTGISTAALSEPGVITGGAGCFGGPAAWVQTVTNIIQCHTYLLLIDNFSLSNSGFNFTWGGATGGMTAEIGPEPIATFNTSVTGCQATISGVTNVPCYTYNWTWGDGASTTGATPGSHTYGAPGTYTITMTVTDALGCEITTSRSVTVCSLGPDEILLSAFEASTSVELNWKLTGAENPATFIVERFGESDFEEISSMNVDYTTTQKEFVFNDPAPKQGHNQYRITMVDVQGREFESNSVSVVYDPSSGQSLTLFPNPAETGIELNFTAAGSGPGTAQILDVTGRVVFSQSFEAMDGVNSLNLDMTGMSPGYYHAVVKQGGSTFRSSFMKR